MKTTSRKLEELFSDMTFAEEREVGLPSQTWLAITARMEDAFTAAAFAEEGEFAAAVCLVDPEHKGCKPRFMSGGTPMPASLCAGRA